MVAMVRGYLERGELAGPPPIDLGNALAMSNVERAVRRMLQDVEMYRPMGPAERELPDYRAWRALLADNLRRLRARLDGRAPHYPGAGGSRGSRGLFGLRTRPVSGAAF
jgi:hypothetical protein